MIIEVWKSDQAFLLKLLKRTHLSRIIYNIQSAEISTECDEFVLFKLTKRDAEELTGQLSFEANHSRSENTSVRACSIAESIEVQLSKWKGAE